jgi:hypothetical protein
VRGELDHSSTVLISRGRWMLDLVRHDSGSKYRRRLDDVRQPRILSTPVSPVRVTSKQIPSVSLDLMGYFMTKNILGAVAIAAILIGGSTAPYKFNNGQRNRTDPAVAAKKASD